uniref:Vanadium-dependent bromoperoxidase 2 n=1 Tax=Laurencia saitoi TaxID=1583034 RepID=A0AAU8HXE0_9FLOR
MEHYVHIPIDYDRRNQAYNVRERTAVFSRDASYSGDDGHVTNGDEKRFPATLLGTFTKGLPHDRDTALPLSRADFKLFVRGIDRGIPKEIAEIPLGPGSGNSFNNSAMAAGVEVRAWESMAAGLAFTLEGPDAQRVTMPPAPQIDSVELGYEMTESYWMALCRDIPFNQFQNRSDDVAQAAKCLAAHPWVNGNNQGLNEAQQVRKQLEINRGLDTDAVFRGVLTGDDVGPYLSQFLLIGCDTLGGLSLDNPETYSTGLIRYGAIQVDQRVRRALPLRDYMTSWGSYIDVTNAADVRGSESYATSDTHRFIHTPRDLSTYVHYDALYEPYLNACLLLLAMGVDLDPGLPFGKPDKVDKQTRFALYGPPHILSVLVEVVTKALKAVRFQKFGVHRRPRPETVAGWIDCVQRPRKGITNEFKPIEKLLKYIDEDLLTKIYDHNEEQNDTQIDRDVPRKNDYDPVNQCQTQTQQLNNESSNGTYLLPMAFAEGSPMHPAYGAGHATVAGACTTVLKAFFDTEAKLPFAFTTMAHGRGLRQVRLNEKLTVEGELNKLASNISIGRNWAGVHWKSDYTESIKMGEEIALGFLREQMAVYTESFTLKVPKFDGEVVTLSSK